MKENKNTTLDYYYYYFLSSLPVPHLCPAHLKLLTFALLRRRKETNSTENEKA
jgi:hypothetical protein